MPQGKPHRLKPISLYPLTVKQAMSAFMAVDPRKVERRMERERSSRSKNK
jgi:hypothetical protein